MEFEFQSRIDIFSSIYPLDEILDILSIPPDEKKIKDQPIPYLKGKYYKENVWSIKSTISSTFDLNEHITFLRSKLIHHIEILKLIRKKFDIQCTCVIKGSSEPPLSIDSENLLFLGEIGASLDIDQYIDFEENEDEDELDEEEDK